ncbi:hypothetical protein PGT21_006815 [Puccinia graminis f. sp. tritici]|uniref:Uncharacterized protein n=1 Tax=Puccinia graminis f. sp. tritici TaxID=56615 RepID=A0A5B0MAH4_PUCGR|nr:hypothetical protein PGTUg99_028410 [Puccinia graminis f. sp. tritici]KAA1090607.1 hypothetical protein PGT21_006815 [Puccinia graminis f. sp. tritici]
MITSMFQPILGLLIIVHFRGSCKGVFHSPKEVISDGIAEIPMARDIAEQLTTPVHLTNPNPSLPVFPIPEVESQTATLDLASRRFSRSTSKDDRKRKISSDPAPDVRWNPPPQEPLILSVDEPRPHQVVKLMGIFLGPQVVPSSSEGNGIVEQSRLQITAPLPVTMKGINSVNQDVLRVSQAPLGSATASNLPGIPCAISASNPIRLGTHVLSIEDSSANAIKENSQGRNQGPSDSSRLTFDKELFTFFARSKKSEVDLQSFLGCFELLSGNELVMQETEFARFHTVFNNRLKAIMETEDDRKPKSKLKKKYPSSGERDKILTRAKLIIWSNKDVWYQHWLKKEGFNFKSCTQKIESYETLRMRKIVTTFLFYVEMISTIIPNLKSGDTVGSKLKEAFELFELLISVTNHTPSNSKKTFKETKMLNEYKVLIRGSQCFFSCVWIALEFWMKIYRKELCISILEHNNSFQTTKTFFNNVFYCSIGRLSWRIQN